MLGPTIVAVAAEVNGKGQRQGVGEAAGVYVSDLVLGEATTERSTLPIATELLAAPSFADGVSDAASPSTPRRSRHVSILPTAPRIFAGTVRPRDDQ